MVSASSVGPQLNGIGREVFELPRAVIVTNKRGNIITSQANHGIGELGSIVTNKRGNIITSLRNTKRLPGAITAAV